MSRRGVHQVIGRLVTDGVFRRRVERGGSAYLAGLSTEGADLNRAEIAALIGVDPGVWASVAKQIDFASNADRTTPDDDGSRVHRALTAQQQRVLAGVCDGLRNQDIAAELGVSESAVKASLQQIFRKLSVRRRVQLVRLALDEPSRSADQSETARSSAIDRSFPERGGVRRGPKLSPQRAKNARRGPRRRCDAGFGVAGMSGNADGDEHGSTGVRTNGAHVAGGADQV